MSLRPHNIRALDGIRGLAIIFVMLHHFEPLIPNSNSVVNAVKLAFSFGWVGVDLFFALSGFLITGILLDTRTACNYFRAFYARRVLRIFPLYYSVLTVILIIAALLHSRPRVVPLVDDQKLYYLYLVNWLVLWKGQWTGNILGHFWSLAVEEQFYFLWPFCVWLFIRRRLAEVAIVASVVALIVRIIWVAHSGTSQAIVMATVTRMDALLCGALAAMLFRNVQALNNTRRWLPWLVGGTLFVFTICGFSLRIVHGAGGELFFVETVGFSLLALGFSSWVLYAAIMDGATTFQQRVLRTRGLTGFGKYSYGIYVYHVPLGIVCIFALHRSVFKSMMSELWFSILVVLLLFALSFVVAKMSYEYFESRFLDLKRHFEARKVAASEIPEAEVAL